MHFLQLKPQRSAVAVVFMLCWPMFKRFNTWSFRIAKKNNQLNQFHSNNIDPLKLLFYFNIYLIEKICILSLKESVVYLFR